MELKSYFTKRDGKFTREGAELRRVADVCGVSPYYLFMVASGHKTASAELAANIEYATRKKVNRRTTLPTFPWDAPITQSVQATS
jgi:DNA-binding transcriptional regulator YdaS (Cro superfamily)